MFLDTTELVTSMNKIVRNDLKVLGVIPISKANNEFQKLALGFVELEAAQASGSVPEEEIRRKYRILKYEFELFFLKRKEFTLVTVESIVNSSLGSVAENVNVAIGFDLIEMEEDSSGISLSFV